MSDPRQTQSYLRNLFDRRGIADVEPSVIEALQMRSFGVRIIGGGGAGAADMNARALGPERLGEDAKKSPAVS